MVLLAQSTVTHSGEKGILHGWCAAVHSICHSHVLHWFFLFVLFLLRFSSHPAAGVVMLRLYAFQDLYHCWMPVYNFCTQLWWKHVLLKYRRRVRLPCWGKPLKKQKCYTKRNTFLQALTTFWVGGCFFVVCLFIYLFYFIFIWPSQSIFIFLQESVCVTVLSWICVVRDFTCIHSVNEFFFSKFCLFSVQC